jgi:hypothetical protein
MIMTIRLSRSATPVGSWGVALLAVLALAVTGPRAASQNTQTWVGGNGGGPQEWGRKQNWSGNLDIGSGDTLNFATGVTNFAMIQNAGGLTNLTLNFNSGNFSLGTAPSTGISASALNIASGAGFYLASSYTMTGPASFTVSGTLGGTGTINASAITIGSGARVSPGGTVANATGAVTNTVGTLNVSSLTVASGGNFDVDIGSFSTLTNVDKLSALGALTLSTGSILNVNNLLSPTTPMDGVPRQYIIGSAGSAPQLTLGTVTINATGFAAGDSFSLSTSGANLILTYTPVPESAAVLGVFAAGLGVVPVWRRLRRRPVPA